jgi:DNA polymerase
VPLNAPGAELLLGYMEKRETARLNRAAGLAPPYVDDPIIQRLRLCNNEREHDRVTIWVRENLREPYADHPDVWFLMTWARTGGNDPKVLGPITPPLPWDRERYLAEMDAHNLRVGVRGYRSWISAEKGEPTHVHLARDLYDPLWAARITVRPKPGDTCQAFFERLLAFDGLGTFLAAQIVADTKFTTLLEGAEDRDSFVAPGPGSRRGLNIVAGRDPEAPWSDATWLEAFRELREEIDPRIEAILGRQLSSQDLQNVCCELSKYHRAQVTGRISRPFHAGEEPLPPKPRKAKSKPEPEAPIVPAPHALPELAATREAGAHVLFFDVETRSAIDLTEVGAHRYAGDPSTTVLCAAFAVDAEPVQLWTPGDAVPPEFIEAAHDPDWAVVAHNAGFERVIMAKILDPRHGFAPIELAKWCCTMAMTLAAALPASLEKVADILELPHRKDKAGAAIMRRMARKLPDQVDDPASLEALFAYCRNDVEVERDLFNALPLLTDAEQALWCFDQLVNERGFCIDRKLLEAAHKIVTEAESAALEEFCSITAISSIHQRDKLLAWLGEHGCPVKDLKKATVSAALRRKELEPGARRALEIRQSLCHAAGAKISTMRAWAVDDRIYGTLKFHGSATGRWSGHGVQPQNIPRSGDNVEEKIATVLAGGDELKEPVATVSEILRATIIAAPGHRLMVGDFSGIESRVLAWIAEEQRKLEMWAAFDRTGDPKLDPYYINGRLCGLSEDKARDVGKTADLACGYQGALQAWRKWDAETDEATVQSYIHTWRAAHPKIKRFWKSIDLAAIRAVRHPGLESKVGRLTLRLEEPFLRLTLPSGRSLSYPFPRLDTNRFGNTCVTFLDNAGGKFVDVKFGQGAYGGLWTENIVQAIARDLLAAAMLRLEAAGIGAVVLHIHDEIIVEAKEGSLEEFRRLIEEVPPWAKGLPIAAKVREGARFCKPDDEAPEAKPDAPEAPPRDELDDPIDDLFNSGRVEPEGSAAAGLEPQSEMPPPEPEPDREDQKANGRDPDEAAYAGNGRAWQNYPRGEERKGKPIATYLYRDHLGKPHTKIEKYRKGNRSTFPQSFWFDGEWRSTKPAGWTRIPYRLPELLARDAAAAVYIPEGEKDAETIAALGLIATTNSEGATPLKATTSKWAPELNRWFHGVGRAYLLADNDVVGRAFAEEKARALAGLVPDVRIVLFPDVPEGEDVTYWLAAGHTKDELVARCEAAPRWQAEELESIRADQVTMRAIDWLWPHRFAVGKIGIVCGLPDQGKGQILCYFAARVTSALEWPNGEGICPRGNVVILSAEEDPGDSLVPRLVAAGADLSRIELLKMVRDHDAKTGEARRRMFSLVTDLEKLRRKIVAVGDVRIVLIDPVSAYLGVGKVDSYRDTDVRAVLGPLKELAEELRVAVVTVMHWNKKTDVTDALLRVSNSMAFVGLPRHAYGVIADSENDRKLFVRAKNNDAAVGDNKTLAFRFATREAGVDPVTGEAIFAPFIVWDQGFVDVSATEALQAASEHKSPGEREKAKVLLLTMLADTKEVPADEIKDAAEAYGIASRTLRRAADDLKVEIKKEAGKAHGKWFWSLPKKDAEAPGVTP